MNRILTGFLFYLLFCIAGYSQPTKGNFYVTGKVKVDQGVVDGTHVELFRNGILIQDLIINRTGTFRVQIDLNQEYKFQFKNDGYYLKSIDFDTHIPPNVCTGDCAFPPFELAVMLYKKVAGVPEMAQAASKISYNSQLDVFDAEILRQKSDLKKMIDEALAEARQKATLYDQQKIKEKKTNFDRLVSEADNLYRTGNLEKSMQSYRDAAMILPNEKYPREQVDKLYSLLVTAELQKSFGIPSEDNFLKYVNYGDLKFSEREYTIAMVAFRNALNVRPSEQSLQSKLLNSEVEVKKIKDLVWEEIEHKKQIYISRQAKYKELNSLGDEKLIKEDVVGAKEMYAQAATQIDENSYALLMLQKIGDIISNEELAIKLSKERDEANKKMLAEARSKAYNDAIKEADRLLSQRLYRDAIENYELAISIKDYELYPKKQIENITDILAKLQLSGEEYNRLLKEAEQLMIQKNYPIARETYQKAHNLIPEEIFAKQKIEEIDRLIKNQNEESIVQGKYSKILDVADALFNQNKYNEAIDPYQQASDIKPSEKYPKDQIQKIREILSKESEDQKLLFQKQTDYDKAISQADEAFKKRSFPTSRSLYLRALQISPGQQYPSSQIKKIDEELNKVISPTNAPKSNFDDIDYDNVEFLVEDIRLAAFKEAMEMGESFLKSKEYAIARFYFRRAIVLYPNDVLANQKLNETDRMIRGNDVNESKYNEFVKKADESFKTGDISVAKYYYAKALDLKPNDPYAKERFDVTDQLLRSTITSAGEHEFDNTIAEGDKAFAAKNYPLARFYYKKALVLKPNNPKAISKIEQSENAIEQEKTNSNNSEFDRNIQMGNQAFQEKKYGQARYYYKQALIINPSDTYTLSQLSKIEALIK